jgi:CheY-like chemotaxis protein
MGSRILVIEDNRTNLELMTYLLKSFGHATSVALDGEAGVDAALRTHPDLILCDLALPRLDGFEVARRLKATPIVREIPLVAVTASAMVGDRDKVLATGFDGYITKPITPETFVSEVESYLRKPTGHGDDTDR